MIIYNGPYCVYVHTNLINGKMYVGLSKNADERWRGNGKNYWESPKFWNAIKKYGWENFDHEIIASNLTREEACNMERLLIKKLKTQDDRFGYNINEGGDAFTPDENARKKLRVLAHNRFAGVPFNQEHKEKISATRTFFSGCVEGKKPIACVETGKYFESVSDASRKLNIPHSSISHVLTGKRPHTHNLHFMYVTSETLTTIPMGVGRKLLASEMAEAV